MSYIKQDVGSPPASGVTPEFRRRTLLVAFITMFLDLVGFGIIIPIQPFLAEHYGATPAVVTLLGASYSLMQFLFAPFWGRLSDRVGRKPIVIVGVTTSIVGYILFGLAGSLGMLFFSRILTGFGNANIGVAQAIVADITSSENRAKGMGMIGAAFGLGFIVGPAVGGALGNYGPNVPAFAAAGFAVVNLGLAIFVLPETLRKSATSLPARTGHSLSLVRLKEALRHPVVAPILAITAVSIAAFALMEQVVGLFIEHARLGAEITGEERIKAAGNLTAIYLVAVGFTAALVQGGLIGRLTRRFGEMRLLRTGVFFLIVAMATAPILLESGSNLLMTVSAVLTAAGMGLLNPSIVSVLSRSTSETEQGGVLGVNQSMSALGRVVGPASAGLLFEIGRGVPFYISSIMFCLALVLTLLIPSIEKPAA